jgi:hypothetical protein
MELVRRKKFNVRKITRKKKEVRKEERTRRK